MADKDTERNFVSALYNGNVKAMRNYAAANPELVNIVYDGRSGIHIAASNHDYNQSREAVSFFLNRGVDVNTQNAEGATILHLAVQTDNYYAKERINDLVKFGANVEARDRQGRTPMHYAVQKGYRTEGLQTLIAHHARVNVADEQGVTPLHLAAQRGDEDTIKFMLASGADIHAVAKNGKTVWDYAVDGGYEYQAQVLKAEAGKQKRAAEQKKLEQERAEQEKAMPKDPWKLLSSDRVSVSTVEKELGYRLTEIFNFSARTYTQITQNLSTKSEGVAVKTFDEFTDKTPIEKAHKALERLGGSIPEAAITGPLVEKPRRNLKLPGVTAP